VQWAPDGKRLAYLAPDDKEFELASAKIWVIELQSRIHAKASRQFDGAIGYYSWEQDSSHIIFSGQERTARNLYRLDCSSSAVRKLTDKPGVLAVSSFTADRTKASAVYSTPSSAPDVWVLEIGRTEKRLTDLNPAVPELALGSAELIRWNG